MSPRLDIPTASLSAVLIAFSSAAILRDSVYLDDRRAEAALCRFQVCSNQQLIDRANAALAQPGSKAPLDAAEDFREALRRDLSYPYRWADLGEAYALSGRIDDATHCFARAVRLAPHFPPILIRAANFHFRLGHPDAALPLTSHILDLVSEYDGLIFLSYARAGLPAATIFRQALPDGARPVRSYFEFLSAGDDHAAAAEVWRWMRERKLTDDLLAARYLQFLLRNSRHNDAMAAWAQHLGPRRGPYPASNRIFNGEFESDFTAAPLDWIPARSDHVRETRDPAVHRQGAWSLRIDFDATANVHYRGISQTAVVSPGPYRFTAAVRTQGVTTNQGIAFRLFDPDSPARLDVSTEALTGTSDWVKIVKDVVIDSRTNAVTVQLYRQPSEKFDNKIAGAVWVDSVELKPAR